MPLTSRSQAVESHASRRSRWAAVWRSIGSTPGRRRVHAFRLFCQSGDRTALAGMLAADVAVVVDSGGPFNPTVRVVRGVEDASVLLLHGLMHAPGIMISERQVNDQPGLVLESGDERVAAITIDFSKQLIAVVWIRLRPENLRRGIHV
ncbi:hypothetical protein [Humibacter albus]|uniref:hypothetical protein n=1 Tax=Humibacter albus TaxID=427754 RepID=UPI0003B71CDE|nr:hypothetical protein [Humibacter albus]